MISSFSAMMLMVVMAGCRDNDQRISDVYKTPGSSTVTEGDLTVSSGSLIPAAQMR